MTRQMVAKHLAILAEASHGASRRERCEKLHFLIPCRLRLEANTRDRDCTPVSENGYFAVWNGNDGTAIDNQLPAMRASDGGNHARGRLRDFLRLQGLRRIVAAARGRLLRLLFLWLGALSSGAARPGLQHAGLKAGRYPVMRRAQRDDKAEMA